MMNSKFRQVALIGKFHTGTVGTPAGSSRQALEEIALYLKTQGCDFVLEKETASHNQLTQFPVMDVNDIGVHCDLGLVVGGDGTMLGIGRQLGPFDVPLIGINQGRLGFITDIPLGGFEPKLSAMLQGEYEEDHRVLIHARVMRDGHCIFDALAMNDVVINRSSTSGMVELRVEVDGHFVANQRADGLIIATPTGSTAYALSAGGPLLHPSIPGWVMVPIAPHTLSNRPVVLPDSSQIAIEIVAGKNASANFDMHSLAALMPSDRIIVDRSDHRVRFLHPKGWTYFDTLRNKLHWNEGVA
jgi:NAD+ kinase